MHLYVWLYRWINNEFPKVKKLAFEKPSEPLFVLNLNMIPKLG